MSGPPPFFQGTHGNWGRDGLQAVYKANICAAARLICRMSAYMDTWTDQEFKRLPVFYAGRLLISSPGKPGCMRISKEICRENTPGREMLNGCWGEEMELLTAWTV